MENHIQGSSIYLYLDKLILKIRSLVLNRSAERMQKKRKALKNFGQHETLANSLPKMLQY
jgi:hypothetical protein